MPQLIGQAKVQIRGFNLARKLPLNLEQEHAVGNSNMAKHWELTEEQFYRLLDWLDADRDQAARRYGLIQLRLIRFFARRGRVDAENLADKTINIVAAKVANELERYVGDKSLYFYGVAKNVDRQEDRNPQTEIASELLVGAVPPAAEPDLIETLLDECMENLKPDVRQLVLRYEEEDKQAKIQHRRILAREIGLSLNALRIKICRLHLQLRKCVEQRLSELPAQ
jgi:hypothetical protein